MPKKKIKSIKKKKSGNGKRSNYRDSRLNPHSPTSYASDHSVCRCHGLPVYKKPPKFKIKDLPKYSKTLRNKNVMKGLQKNILGGKYSSRQPIEEDANEDEDYEIRGKKPLDIPENVEWTKTPVYK